MTQFFKSIRKGLISRGKIGRYIKYAIGEITLVVIGILIALQVNNWNELTKSNKKERILLLQLKEEYQNNLLQLNSKIELRKKVIFSSLKLLKHIDNTEAINRDSIIYYISQSNFSPTFDPVTNQIITSGDFNLLKNQKLKKKLSTWTSDLIQVKEEEDAWNEFKNNVRTPFLVKHNIARDLYSIVWNHNQMNDTFIDETSSSQLSLSTSIKAINYDSIVRIPEFESILAVGISRNTIANIQSYTLQMEIDSIVALIDESLKSLQLD
ncbi:MAG: DUF6090 family protein [bacterium]|nr:DUF6090 family protein [bacterium]